VQQDDFIGGPVLFRLFRRPAGPHIAISSPIDDGMGGAESDSSVREVVNVLKTDDPTPRS
jgi:hypothetical protein